MGLWSEDLSELPIHTLEGIEGRMDVDIQECGDPLVLLSHLRSSRIRLLPEYYLKGFKTALRECYVRKLVSEMLTEVANSLPTGINLLIYDAWRPTALQRELYERQKILLRQSQPNPYEKKFDRKAEIYVSFPSTDAKAPAPHLTGGAVDATLCDDLGKPLNMGTPFDFFGPKARTRYFEDQLLRNIRLSNEDRIALQNRRLLFHSMIRVGFTNYCEEWWHFDFGNQFWGKINKKIAIYGGINGQ